MIGEGHRRQYFAAGHIFKGAGPDDPFGWDDFPIDAVRVMLVAVGRAHAEAITPACAEIHLAHWESEAIRAKPVHDVLGLGPRFEHERSRCVEDSRDDELPRRRFRDDGGISSSRHVSTPSPATLVSPRGMTTTPRR